MEKEEKKEVGINNGDLTDGYMQENLLIRNLIILLSPFLHLFMIGLYTREILLS